MRLKAENALLPWPRKGVGALRAAGPAATGCDVCRSSDKVSLNFSAATASSSKRQEALGLASRQEQEFAAAQKRWKCESCESFFLGRQILSGKIGIW